MSSTEEKDLVAGHPPAVKAGGRRISQRHNSTGDKSDKPITEFDENGDEVAASEQKTDSPPKTDKHNQQILLSGTLTKGDQDFTDEAVKHYHSKPMPAKEKRPVNTTHNIHQPR